MGMRSGVPFVVIAGSSLLLWLGCGVSSSGNADLLAGGDAGDATTGPSSSSGSAGPTTDGGQNGDDGAVVADGGIDPADAGPGGDTSKLSCGAAACAIPGQTCCVSALTGGASTAFSCVNGPTCPSPAGGGETAALACSGAANCPQGTVCCIRSTNSGAASECKATCGKSEAQLCDAKAANTGCSPTEPCSNESIDDWGNLPAGYATCGGKGT